MPNIKISQLPVTGNLTAATIVPVVQAGVNYQVSGANLQTFVNSSTGNITGGNIISTGVVAATGNVSGAYILGNGSLLTGLPALYGNANVAAYLPTFTGNLAGGNAIITSGVSAATFAGSGAALTNLPGANVSGTVANAAYATAAGSATTATSATTAGTVTTGAQPSITSVGTLTSLATSGNITAVGNIAGSYFIGNGAALTGIVANTTYNDSNVAAFLPTYTGAMTAMTGGVTTTGNVQGAYVKGNGSQLTGTVTSILAGSGISVSGSTGAVTITNTGAGSSTSISNGTSNVSIASANGNISVSTAGRTNLALFQSSAPLVTITGNLFVDNPTQQTGGSTTDGFIEVRNYINCFGNITASGRLNGNLFGTSATVTNITAAGVSTLDHLKPNQATSDRYFEIPVWTRAAAAGAGGVATGAVGRIISISDSPTQAGRMAYWSTTSSSWRYISDDTAI